MSYSSYKQEIDRDGYRRNVGIIICNTEQQVLWARRVRHDGWQFPQGGIESSESPEQAAFRELYEEVGLSPLDVKLLGSTESWLRYDVPYFSKTHSRNRRFRGQKQRWFMFRLLSAETCVCLDKSSTPEFDDWRWIEYWHPVKRIVPFKKDVYKKALSELEHLLKLV